MQEVFSDVVWIMRFLFVNAFIYWVGTCVIEPMLRLPCDIATFFRVSLPEFKLCCWI